MCVIIAYYIPVYCVSFSALLRKYFGKICSGKSQQKVMSTPVGRKGWIQPHPRMAERLRQLGRDSFCGDKKAVNILLLVAFRNEKDM